MSGVRPNYLQKFVPMCSRKCSLERKNVKKSILILRATPTQHTAWESVEFIEVTAGGTCICQLAIKC
jgi:hypothetical protein